jgi:hypothetical protein
LATKIDFVLILFSTWFQIGSNFKNDLKISKCESYSFAAGGIPFSSGLMKRQFNLVVNNLLEVL